MHQYCQAGRSWPIPADAKKPVDPRTEHKKEATAILNIALCDDQPKELETVNEYIKEYLDTHALEAEIKQFSHPDVLLTAIEAESFAEYSAPILKDRHFLQCHSSFVVNMLRVKRFAKDSFTLRGGKVVPIAAKQYYTVRDAYMDYLME